MTAPTVAVEMFFDLDAVGGDFFTVGDPTKGELGGSFGLAGADGVPTDIAGSAHEVSIGRGRTFELDEFNTGVCTVLLRNYDARFLPAGLDTDELEVFGADAIRPGRRCRVSIDGITVFDGRVEDWNFAYRNDGRVDAEVILEDALASLARTSFTEWTTASQLAGARVEAVLNRSEVGFGANRDIDDGVSTLQSDLVTWGSNVRNYLSLVAESDLGRLFVSRDGVLKYQDRRSMAGASTALTLGSGRLTETLQTADGEDLQTADGEDLQTESDTEIVGTPITEIAVEYGSEVLYTRVQVGREGGTAQTANDADAQDAYGVRSLALSGLLLSSDGESSDMASFLLSTYKSPRHRFRRVAVALDPLSELDRAAVLALDIGSVVNVIWRPVGMSAATRQTLVVEGINVSTSVDGLAVVSFDLAPLFQERVFVVEDSELGVLDVGAGLAF